MWLTTLRQHQTYTKIERAMVQPRQFLRVHFYPSARDPPLCAGGSTLVTSVLSWYVLSGPVSFCFLKSRKAIRLLGLLVILA
jgi:hypothetical protein